MIDESISRFFELETSFLQRINDLFFVAERNDDIVGIVSGDEKDRAG